MEKRDEYKYNESRPLKKGGQISSEKKEEKGLKMMEEERHEDKQAKQKRGEWHG